MTESGPHSRQAWNRWNQDRRKGNLNAGLKRGSLTSSGWPTGGSLSIDHNRGPVPLSEMFDKLLKRLKKPPTDVLSAVFEQWESIVGPDVACHCRPVAVDANSLVVEADEPIWADELRWHSEAVLARIAEISDNHQLKKLTVRVGYHRSSVNGRTGRRSRMTRNRTDRASWKGQ